MKHLIDMHCHIIAGVDDGAKDVTESINLLKLEKEQGVDRIILTPHYRVGMFETPQYIIDREYAKLCLLEKEMNLGISLCLGCEFHSCETMIDDLFLKTRRTMVSTKFVLVEFSSLDSYSKIRKQIYELVSNGWIPIIAHIERYPAFVENFRNVHECKRLGAYMQITSGAILGKTGWRMKKLCKELIKRNLVDFIASDAHNIKNRKPDLGECAKYLEKKYGQEYVHRILIKNPEMVLGGFAKHANNLFSS